MLWEKMGNKWSVSVDNYRQPLNPKQLYSTWLLYNVLNSRMSCNILSISPKTKREAPNDQVLRSMAHYKPSHIVRVTHLSSIHISPVCETHLREVGLWAPPHPKHGIHHTLKRSFALVRKKAGSRLQVWLSVCFAYRRGSHFREVRLLAKQFASFGYLSSGGDSTNNSGLLEAFNGVTGEEND